MKRKFFLQKPTNFEKEIASVIFIRYGRANGALQDKSANNTTLQLDFLQSYGVALSELQSKLLDM